MHWIHAMSFKKFGERSIVLLSYIYVTKSWLISYNYFLQTVFSGPFILIIFARFAQAIIMFTAKYKELVNNVHDYNKILVLLGSRLQVKFTDIHDCNWINKYFGWIHTCAIYRTYYYIH